MDFIETIELETYTLICLSTAHISSKTRRYLDACVSGNKDIIVYRKDDVGWFIPVPDDKYPIPVDLADCIAFAEKHGAEYLMFDSDGPIYSELKSYEDDRFYLESICISTDEHICSFTTTANPYVPHHFIISNDSTDIGAALKDTFQRILDSGGTNNDIINILGAEITEKSLKEKCINIDLCCRLRKIKDLLVL